ncbi:MAG: peptide deformylase [Firmicutes bacterium]|nr:peptide deformylase [Bacillota bacterium]
MATRTILQEGDKTLRTKSREVIDFSPRLWQLLDDMKETLSQADGVGLAAPQVGILRRVAIVWYNEELIELVNPKITASEGEVLDSEGCLSVQKEGKGMVKRPKTVTVSYQNRFGKAMTLTKEDWVARIICHELDHLDGVLFIDRIEGAGEEKSEK